MQKDAAPSAVRVLPPDNATPATNHDDPVHTARWRWLLPLFATLGALLVFATGTGDNGAAPATASTTPPAISALEVRTTNLASQFAVPVTATTDWEEASVQPQGHINDVVSFNGSLVGIGATADGAMAWLSGTGAGWRNVRRLPKSDSVGAVIEHAAVWDGKIVALGRVDDGDAMWTAQSPSSWDYHGSPEAIEGSVIGLAPGPDLLAITEREGFWAGVRYDDSDDWTALNPLHGLDDLSAAMTLSGGEAGYFLGGEEHCLDSRCRPAIYRSADGVSWERTSIELPAAGASQGGTVVDIAQSASGELIAVGMVGPLSDMQVAVWASAEGSEWWRIAADDPSFQPATTRVELATTNPGAAARAEIRVDIGGATVLDGSRVVADSGTIPLTVTVGSQVITDAGAFQITKIGDDGIHIEHDGTPYRLAVGRSVELERAAKAWRVATQGNRIVVVGAYVADNRLIPLAWTSPDGGDSWEMTRLSEDEGASQTAIVKGKHIIVAGAGSGQSPRIWHSTWDTSAAEAAGISAVEGFLDALNRRDVDAIATVMPAVSSGSADPVIQVPSLGFASMHWWDSSGGLDYGAITDTLQYLEALDTSIEVDTCTSRMNLGDGEDLRVSCGFVATSDFTKAMSSQPNMGRVDIAVSDRTFDSVMMSRSPSQSLWELLVAGFVGALTDDLATVLRMEPSGQTRLDPTFTAATASMHMRLVDEFIAGLLRPGETKVVATGIGTMEWQWTTDLPFPAYTVDWVTATRAGFVALGYGDPARWTEEFSLFRSEDGLEWEEIEPPEVHHLWAIGPYGDGLLARAWRDDTALLLVLEGGAWTEIVFPGQTDNSNQSLMDVAVSGDKILAFTGTWTEEGHGLTSADAWLIGPDLLPRKTELPTEALWSENTMGLVGSDAGFVLATSQYGTASSMAVWHSPDGSGWKQIARSSSIEDASYVWEFQTHLDKFFVVGEGAETSCSTSSSGDQTCQQLVSLWSSPDGVAWDRVVTNAGEPLATHTVGSGPLGLAAIGQEFWENRAPRPIYLSRDGSSWDRAGNLALLHPDVEWWWVNRPAVGSDTIVIPGAAYRETLGEDHDVPFLIVGRLLDG